MSSLKVQSNNFFDFRLGDDSKIHKQNKVKEHRIVSNVNSWFPARLPLQSSDNERIFHSTNHVNVVSVGADESMQMALVVEPGHSISSPRSTPPLQYSQSAVILPSFKEFMSIVSRGE